MAYFFPNPATLLPATCSLARRAGALVMSVYYSNFPVLVKADKTPLTAADQLSECLITEELQLLTPDIPIVAEEAVKTFSSQTRVLHAFSAHDVFWLVDPLDGTSEFVQHGQEFTVNIALIANRCPVLGVVYVPAADKLYAAAGLNLVLASKSSDRSSIEEITRNHKSDGIRVIASKGEKNTPKNFYRLKSFLRNYVVQSVSYVSSSLKLCLLAAGEVDIYPRFSQSMEWDTAAGHAILKAAGGCIRIFNGEEELYYGKHGYYNPWFIAYSPYSYHLTRKVI